MVFVQICLLCSVSCLRTQSNPHFLIRLMTNMIFFFCQCNHKLDCLPVYNCESCYFSYRVSINDTSTNLDLGQSVGSFVFFLLVCQDIYINLYYIPLPHPQFQHLLLLKYSFQRCILINFRIRLS